MLKEVGKRMRRGRRVRWGGGAGPRHKAVPTKQSLKYLNPSGICLNRPVGSQGKSLQKNTASATGTGKKYRIK